MLGWLIAFKYLNTDYIASIYIIAPGSTTINPGSAVGYYLTLIYIMFNQYHFRCIIQRQCTKCNVSPIKANSSETGNQYVATAV